MIHLVYRTVGCAIVSKRLTKAQSDPKYWDDLKYYLRTALDEAWEERDEEFWVWAVERSKTNARCRGIIENFIDDPKWGLYDGLRTVEDFERYIAFCQKHELNLSDSLLAWATRYSLEHMSLVLPH